MKDRIYLLVGFFTISLLLQSGLSTPQQLSFSINGLSSPLGSLLLPVATAQVSPVKVLRDEGSETWQLPNGNFVFKSGGEAPKTVYDFTNNKWVNSIVKAYPDNSLEVQTGRISTLFNVTDVSCSIKHFTENMSKVSSCENARIMKKVGTNYVEQTKTFVSRTYLVLQIPITESVGGFTITDSYDSITVTENYNTPSGTLRIDYLFKQGDPLKHTFTFTTNNIETYRLYHAFTTQITKYTASNGQTFTIPDGSITLTKSIVGELIRHLEFKNNNNELLLGEIVAGSI
ncbi:MAG: hypothetical protein ACRD9Q_01510, partial [Nitrososphaeraceae archaeon]